MLLGKLNYTFMTMTSFASKAIIAFIVIVLLTCAFYIIRLNNMFEPHDYDWRTGQPSLATCVNTFESAKKRWPKDYEELTAFMKQVDNKFEPTSYDRIDFTTKPDGSLEIQVIDSGMTNLTLYSNSTHKQ